MRRRCRAHDHTVTCAGDRARDGVRRGNGLVTNSHEGHAVGEGVGASVTSRESVIPGDRRPDAAIGLGEVDGAGVVRSQVVGRVPRCDCDRKRRAGGRVCRGSDREVGGRARDIG